MAQFGRFYVPPVSAIVNVVRETAKSLVPEDSPCLEMFRKMTGTDVEQQEQRQASQARRQAGRSGVFESSTSYDEIEGENRGSRMNSLDDQGYQRSGPEKFSMSPGSFDDGETSEGGGGEFRSRHKINEWQAAWNVTNAIQVSKKE